MTRTFVSPQVAMAAALVCSLTAHAQNAGTAASGTSTPAVKPNSFNPAIALILSGTYANLSKDPETWRTKGFVAAGEEAGPGERGFSLGESELGISANIDHYFFGSTTLAVTGENEVEVEEAFVQTTALPDGWKIKAGRFFSGLGYLNEQHAHTWDFIDAPLAYQAMLGGKFAHDGLQVKWLAPLDQFLELGVETGNGKNFPGTGRNRNGSGATTWFAHVGGDVGVSHSWRAGVSYLKTHAQDRALNADDELFTGQSDVWVLDGVWKWAPNGNATQTNLKLQGEYFRRKESGEATVSAGAPDAYRTSQSGWYVQGLYQFMPRWKVGLRYDQLDSGTIEAGSNTSLVEEASKPSRTSVILDWSLTEFSKLRLQINDDKARVDTRDRQIFLQYQMSLGAHGAHSY